MHMGAQQISRPTVSAVTNTTCAPSTPVFTGTDICLYPADISVQAWWSLARRWQAGHNQPELPQLPTETTEAGMAPRPHRGRLPVVGLIAIEQVLLPLEAS